MQALPGVSKFNTNTGKLPPSVQNPCLQIANMQVVCGELGESVLEQLSALSQDVVLPLLSNPANHVGISEGVGREVQSRLHQFIADGMLNPTI